MADPIFPMANGEGAIGYQYLHGTLYFEFNGTIALKKDDQKNLTYWEFELEYNWKDQLSKNENYGTDIVKNAFAETITFGGAAPYWVQIKWEATSYLECTSSGVGWGWPFKQ